MFIKRNEEIIREAFDKRAESIRADLKDIEFSEEYKKRKSEILSRPVNKRTKKAVFISRAASIAAVVCMVVVAGIVTTKIGASKDDTFKTKLDEIYNNSDAVTETPKGTPQKVTVTLGDKKVELEYTESSTEADGVVVNKYKDSNDSRYTLDQKGNVIMYLAGKTEKDANAGGEKLSEKQIHAIALKEYKKVYPDYEKDSIFLECNCADTDESFFISFAKKYGKDDFVIGENFSAIVSNNGFIKGWSMRELDTMENFDQKLLDGLTKKTVEDYALKTAKALHPGFGNDYRVGNIYVQKVDESYALGILVYYGDGLETVYYELG